MNTPRRPRKFFSDVVSNRSLSLLVDFVVSGLPFLPVVPLLLLSPTWELRGTFQWEFHGKLDGPSTSSKLYSHFAAFLLTGAFAPAGASGIGRSSSMPWDGCCSGSAASSIWRCPA
jgi:hypothetical protein